MSNRRLVLTFVVLITGTEPGVCAEEPLEVEAYIQGVLRAHPAVRQAAALDGAAAAERKAARLPPDPEVGLSRGRAHATDTSGSAATEKGFSVSQTIPWPGTFAASIRAADHAADALRATADEARWGLAVEARRAFTQLAASRELLGIARAAEEDARSLRDLLTRRADLGESRESDRIKATVEWLRQQRSLASAEREAASAEEIARRLAGEPLPQPLEIQPIELPDAPVPDLDTLQALADLNPALRAARAEAARREALASAARRARIPDLAATFFRDHEIDKRSMGFSVALKVPLWNANRGEIARAEAAALGAAAAAARARIDTGNALQTRRKELQIAATEVESLRRDILPAASQSLDLARFSYEEGETSLLDLLDAQRTFRDTQREAAEAGLTLGLAWAELQRLVGPDFNPWSVSR